MNRRVESTLRSVSLDGVLEIEGAGKIRTPVDIFQMSDGRIVFTAEFAGSYARSYDDHSKPLYIRSIRGQDRSNPYCTVRTKGHLLVTRAQSRVSEIGEYSSIEDIAFEVILLTYGARQLKELKAERCEATIHNFRPVRSAARQAPLISLDHFGVSATLAPLDGYREVSGELERFGGNQSTYQLQLQSKRRGARRTSSWLSLCSRICTVLSLQNLASVWLSTVTFTHMTFRWEHWFFSPANPFSSAGKNVCDGMVSPMDALKIALSQSTPRKLRVLGSLVNHLLDAITLSHELDQRTLLLCTLIESIMSHESGLQTSSYLFTKGQRKKAKAVLSTRLRKWAESEDGLNPEDLDTVIENLSWIFRPPSRYFRDGLHYLIEAYSLPEAVPVENISSARNALVHTGKLRTGSTSGRMESRLVFQDVAWTSVALLWRLLGFRGDFSEFGTFSRP